MARAAAIGSPATQRICSTRHAPASLPMKLNRRGMEGTVAVMCRVLCSEAAALKVQTRGFLLIGFLDAHRILFERRLPRIRIEQAQGQAVHAVMEVKRDEQHVAAHA